MYPDGDLNELAIRKLVVRQRISMRRRECVEAAERVAEPLEKIDRALAQWRRISPFAKVAAVPLAMLFKKALFPRAKILGSVLRWGPIALKVFRGFRAAR
jgi:hypothetical protein